MCIITSRLQAISYQQIYFIQNASPCHITFVTFACLALFIANSVFVNVYKIFKFTLSGLHPMGCRCQPRRQRSLERHLPPCTTLPLSLPTSPSWPPCPSLQPPPPCSTPRSPSMPPCCRPCGLTRRAVTSQTMLLLGVNDACFCGQLQDLIILSVQVNFV